MTNLLRPPVLTRRRIWMALAVGVIADGLQVCFSLFGPIGYAVADVIDIVAMILVTWLIGFHPLFLPTFVAEFLPVVDMLPTWTGCVAVVLALRKKQQQPAAPPPPPPRGDVIDI